MSVADLPLSAGHSHSRPSFLVKYPSHLPGTPKPAPIFTRKISLSDPCSALGGKAAPSNWSRPASVAQFSVPPKHPGPGHLAASGLAMAPTSTVTLPQARAPRFVSAQALTESRRRKLAEQFRNILLRVGPHCALRSILAESAHAEQHVERLLAAFAVNTLFRYIACCFTFLDFMQAQHFSMEAIPVAQVVDFLHVALSSKRQDRAVHRTSCGTAIKALRWLAKHLQWQALQLCTQNNLVTSYAKQVEAYDKREAVPLPLSLLLAWERCVCCKDTPLTTKLILGAILACTCSSIRFGDAQRVRWGSMQLSTQGLRATFLLHLARSVRPRRKHRLASSLACCIGKHTQGRVRGTCRHG